MEKSQKKLEILVVDDEPGWQDLLLLELSEDYQIAIASGAQEALNLLRQRPFDLVITDVRMPGEFDGIDLIQVYRRENSAQKAIFITGYALEEKIEQAVQQGLSLCLRKPFESQQLLNAIQSLLAK